MIEVEKRQIFWLSGLSSSGKSTLANAIGKKLSEEGILVKLLDGDVLRMGINNGLGFSDEDRMENIRRAAEIAKLFQESGFVPICSFITPLETMRDLVKDIIEKENLIEIFVNCSLEECEKRDVKGLYKKVRNGEISQFTGISSTFEIPQNPNIIVDTENHSIEECVEQILKSVYF